MALACGGSLASAPAVAQLSLYATEIELKALDVHPKPRLRNETGTFAYGAVDLGLQTRPSSSAQGRCGTEVPSSVSGSSVSLVGFRGQEQLSGGWRAGAQLEQGFVAGTGLPSNDCGTLFDRALFVSLSHPHWGALTLGRSDHPAYTVALTADPWAGASVASPGDGDYYSRPVDAGGVALPGSRYRVRAPESVTFTTATHRTVWASAQFSLRRSAEVQAAGMDPDQREAGLALHLQTAQYGLAAGFQRWNPDTWAFPVAATMQSYPWMLRAGLTRGQLSSGRYLNVLLGLDYAERSGPFKGVYRVALNRREASSDKGTWKLGAGYARPLARRTQLELAGALESNGAGRYSLQAGASIRHEFRL